MVPFFMIIGLFHNGKWVCLWAILLQLAQVSFVLFPADVSRMGIPDEKRPLLLWDRLDRERAISTFAGVGASIAEGTGVAGIVEHVADRVVKQRGPIGGETSKRVG